MDGKCRINKKFRPLNENVVDEDAFSDGTHKKVAESLCSLITESDSSVTGGLEGKWGSGKTTVLQLLKKEIDIVDENILFFSFDAWAHEGDPLRRIFLEMLLDSLPFEFQDDKLDGLRKKISGKRKTIEVTTVREISKLGVALTLSAMLIPIGVSMLSIIDMTHVSLPFTATAEGIHWPVTVSFFLLGTPLLIVAIWWVATIGKKRRWAFMQSVTTDDYIQDVTGDPDKTSVEFERYFKEILIEMVGMNKPFKKAIIVLDNIDRLSKEHIRNVWSTMQSFFQHRNICGNGADELASSIWFIIPYDRKNLAEALDGGTASTGRAYVPMEADSIASFPPKQSSGPSLTVLEKSIQVTAEVPEPAMTGWSEYLDSCIDYALGAWPSDEKCMVRATCHTCLASLTHSPTPRRLRSLVNQIGFNGMRWLGELGADSIVIYSILKLDVSTDEMRSMLLSHNGLSIQKHDNPVRIRNEIVAMLFGLPVERALQILLGEEIKMAIEPGGKKSKDNRNGASLADLYKIFGDAFWIAWKASWADMSPTESHDHKWLIAITINIQNQLGEFLDKVNNEITQIRDVWKESRHEWELSRYRYAGAVSVLIGWFPDDRVLFRSITESLLSGLRSNGKNGRLVSLFDEITVQQAQNIIPQIYMAAAIAYKEGLRDAEGIPPFVVSFWESGRDEDLACLKSLNSSIDMVGFLSSLEGLDGYNTAKRALKLFRKSKS